MYTSFHIIRDLFFNRNIERNAIYREEYRQAYKDWPNDERLPPPGLYGYGCSVGVLLVLLLFFLSYTATTTQTSDLPLFFSFIVSVGWMLPVIIVAGKGLRRERENGTLELLLVTTASNQEIIVAKMCAQLKKLAKTTVGFLSTLSIIGSVLWFFLLVLDESLSTQGAVLLPFLFPIIAMLSFIEHLHELALAAVLGSLAATIPSSTSITADFAFLICFLIRLAQLLFVLGLVGSLGRGYNLAGTTFLNMMLGSTSTYPDVNLLSGLAVTATFFAVREIIIVVSSRLAVHNLSRA